MKVNTNTIEGYYSIFKRGMKGVYQQLRREAFAPLFGRVRFPLFEPLQRLALRTQKRAAKIVEGAKGKRLQISTA